MDYTVLIYGLFCAVFSFFGGIAFCKESYREKLNEAIELFTIRTEANIEEINTLVKMNKQLQQERNDARNECELWKVEAAKNEMKRRKKA